MRSVIIGGGAAGLMAAYTAASSGYDTTLIEKNEKLGKKIYITGKGRCNVTNDVCAEEFLQNIVTNSKFMTSGIYSFPPSKLMELLESNGLLLKVERGNRVFPASDKSSDVIKCFEKICINSGVKFRLNEKVDEILVENGVAIGVKTNKERYLSDKVVIATGGLSYSQTGSNGDGYKFAEKLGHTVISPKPALSAIKLRESFCEKIMGLSLKNVKLIAKRNGKVIKEEFGEMLFTHFGISGPIVLTISSFINKEKIENIEFFLDLKPALDYETLDNRILRDFSELKNRQLKNSLDLLLPKALVPIVISVSQLDGEKSNNSITKKERQKLVETLKGLKLTPIGLNTLDEAIVTSGGIITSEINPKTMESKLVKGLFFAGEVIDVDALTGGFNLQIAFSTGRLAGLFNE